MLLTTTNVTSYISGTLDDFSLSYRTLSVIHTNMQTVVIVTLVSKVMDEEWYTLWPFVAHVSMAHKTRV